MKLLLALIVLGASAMWAQSPASPAKPAPLSPGIALSEPFFPFPAEERGKIRDLQYESDQLEIANSGLLLQIEKNKAQQAALLDRIRAVAFEYATQKKIDLSQYDLDPKEVKFIKKKK